MVEMDGWCPSCGYSIDPGTRFCGGCGYQLGPAPDASPAGSSTVTMQAPAPFQGYPQPAAPQAQAGPAAPLSAPPPSGSPLPYPPPPLAGTQAPAAFGGPPPADEPTAAMSDTVDRMLRPQGLFQNAQQVPAGWQQPYPPAPGPYPPAGQYPLGGQYPPGASYPPGAPYPQEAAYPQGGQYPPTGGFQQAAPPQPWGAAPSGAFPAAPPTGGMPAVAPVGPGQPGAGYPGGGYPGPYQNGQYAGPQYGSGQYGNGQYPQDQYGQEQFPPGPYGPGVQYGPDGMPLGGDDGRPGWQARLPFKRPKGPLVPVTVGGGVLVIVIAALLLATHNGSGSNAASSGTTPGATPTSSAAGSSVTQQQAATALSGLLAQSGTDHADVDAAVSNVEACGTGLAHDAQVFSTAAANRGTLLSKLAQLPGRPALSPAMIADLTGAWQASATVDADLAKWAADAAGHCRKGNLNDPNYTATIPFDSKATNEKIAFVKLWNPLAKKDGLPTYQSAQL
jgi:hypothetical protein